ncbi:MAG: HoxN/HupN/NixA family nickel/cobalt transporter [Hyphomicrobiales bacterium]|nr:HoxN/HupN/NixA family nickel/cobalt transporter [Hyphomicrobiales bacterium]MDE2018048.1 HoxN/HupN/NixA family nickel/cobalt transporter [Hyphomicrobiales bacterium]
MKEPTAPRAEAKRLRARVALVAAALVAANAAAWIWAAVSFRGLPLLLGTASLAYVFGLRHAVDPDHIAAIDNVTRKLLQDGRRQVGVGLYFSLGHSTVVVALSAAIAFAATGLEGRFAWVKETGAVIGTAVSASFLFMIAAANVPAFVETLRAWRRARAGGGETADGRSDAPVAGGPITRLCRRAFSLIGTSWHMYPLGFLFGLGFDTATEVGLLGMSASQASQGLPIWSIMVFPALFTAGMSLVDTADGVLMLGAYDWALARPGRRLTYNLAVTGFSVFVAVGIGAVEVLGLVRDRLHAVGGGLWRAVAALDGHSFAVGSLVVTLFAAAWLASFLSVRAQD